MILRNVWCKACQNRAERYFLLNRISSVMLGDAMMIRIGWCHVEQRAVKLTIFQSIFAKVPSSKSPYWNCFFLLDSCSLKFRSFQDWSTYYFSQLPSSKWKPMSAIPGDALVVHYLFPFFFICAVWLRTYPDLFRWSNKNVHRWGILFSYEQGKPQLLNWKLRIQIDLNHRQVGFA